MKYLLLGPAILLSSLTMAQLTLAEDIRPGVFSSIPTRLTVYNGQLYMFANDGTHGNELRRYNGSATSLVKDIYSGPTDCAPAPGNLKMAELNYKLYFPADDGSHGLELYSYDGVNNPVMISDINTGIAGSEIEDLVTLNGKLYFDANNGTNGKELWEYDPNTNQVQQVTFINTGPGCDPQYLTIMDGRLYFTAFASAKGRELWVYDPATGIATMVADIVPSLGSSLPQSLCALPGKLFFSAHTTDYGRELYMYDGSNVQRLTDLNPGNPDGVGEWNGMPTIFLVGNETYFAGDTGGGYFYQLYKYDIATGTPSLAATINPAGPCVPSNFIYYAGKIFFGAEGPQGRELYMYDGQNATMLGDLNQSIVVTTPNEMTIYKGVLYFTHYGADGTELYKYTDPKGAVYDRQENNIEVTVFPNPVLHHLFVRLSLQQRETLHIQVTDATGRQVYASYYDYTTGDHTVSVPANNWPPGVYVYRIQNANGEAVSAGRLVKM